MKTTYFQVGVGVACQVDDILIECCWFLQ